MEILSTSTPAKTAGTLLSDTLVRYQNIPILLLLSGGSALSVLEEIDERVLGSHITITTLDERFTFDPAHNNFAKIKTMSFYKKAVARGVQEIATTMVEHDTLQAAGQRFETELVKWRSLNPNGVVLATMGVGADGHVAGIFPGDYGVDFFATDWVVAYEVPKEINEHTKRITVSYTFLQEQIMEAVMYVIGEQKRTVLEYIKEERCEVEQMPACIVRSMKKVVVATDLK